MATGNEHPFGGFFGVIGGLTGFGYGAYVTDGQVIAALIIALIGAGLGLIVEHVVFRLIVVALFVLGFVIRQEIWGAISSGVFG